MNILEICHLSKKFEEKTVLDDISFAVKQGSVFGFLGENGAGKTTTMKIILGLLRADMGDIRVVGNRVHFGETITNKDIGYLPDVPSFYGYMRAKEYLSFCGRICGMSLPVIAARTSELLKLVGLEGVHKKIATFSRGMKQRLGIAQALLNEPKLLICDEPTSALDPKGRKEILDILLSIKGKTTVLFSTHILSDAERICDEVVILHKGKIALEGKLSEIKHAKRKDIIALTFEKSEQAIHFSHLLKEVALEVKENRVLLYTNDMDQTQKQMYHCIDTEKLFPLAIEMIEPTLESMFLEVTE